MSKVYEDSLRMGHVWKTSGIRIAIETVGIESLSGVRLVRCMRRDAAGLVTPAGWYG